MTSLPDTLNKLDTELRLTMQSETKFGEHSKKFKISAYLGLYFGDKYTEGTYYFSSKQNISRDTAMFLRQYNAIEKNGVWRIKREIPEPSEPVQIVKDLIEVPSSIITDLWFEKGQYQAGFLFHHSDIKKVSNIVMDISSKPMSLTIDYFGPTEGYLTVLSKIDERMGLYVAEVESTIPPESLKPEIDPFGDSWTRILKNPYGGEKGNGIYFTNGKSPKLKNFLMIEKNSIYQGFAENPYSSYVNKELNTARVATIGRMHEFKSPKFNATVIIPAILSQEWLSVWKATVDDFSSWKPVLTSFTSFSSWAKRES